MLRRPLVIIAAYKMDMTAKLVCVIGDRLLISIGKVLDYIYMIAKHDNSIPVCEQHLVMLINICKNQATIKTDAGLVTKMQARNIKVSAHFCPFACDKKTGAGAVAPAPAARWIIRQETHRRWILTGLSNIKKVREYTETVREWWILTGLSNVSL